MKCQPAKTDRQEVQDGKTDIKSYRQTNITLQVLSWVRFKAFIILISPTYKSSLACFTKLSQCPQWKLKQTPPCVPPSSSRNCDTHSPAPHFAQRGNPVSSTRPSPPLPWRGPLPFCIHYASPPTPDGDQSGGLSRLVLVQPARGRVRNFPFKLLQKKCIFQPKIIFLKTLETGLKPIFMCFWQNNFSLGSFSFSKVTGGRTQNFPFKLRAKKISLFQPKLFFLETLETDLKVILGVFDTHTKFVRLSLVQPGRGSQGSPFNWAKCNKIIEVLATKNVFLESSQINEQ